MRKNNKGFSLIELIVAMVIMSVLAVMFVSNYLEQTRKSKRSVDISNAEQVVDTLLLIYAEDETVVLPTFTWNKSTLVEGNGVYSKVFKTLGGVPVSEMDEDLYWKVNCYTDAQGYYTIDSVYLLDAPSDSMGYEVYPDITEYLTKYKKVAMH